MKSTSEGLLQEVEAFCRNAGIAESTFGRQAVNDGKLCSRLRAGKSVTLETAARVRDYIQLQSAPDPSTDDSVDPEIQNQLDTLFDAAGADAPDLSEGALIVLVDEGDVSVDGVFLGEGEGVVTGGVDTPEQVVRVDVPEVQIIRIPPPNVIEENSALLENLGNSFDIEFNDNGQMCIGF